MSKIEWHSNKLILGKAAFLAVMLCLFAIPSAHAQMEVNGSVPVEDAVQLFTGKGIKVKNARYAGAPVALGTYKHDGMYPAFAEGIILSTGKALDFAGPNDKPKTSSLNGQAGDRDLSLMAGTRTFDMAAIDFDFMADRDSVSFNFYFASEEYNEFVGSTFNDVFAIIVTGPGLGQGVNLALVPGTEQPIHINTVSVHENRRYFRDNNPFKLNGSMDDGLKAKLNPELLQNCQYDGMTKPISVGIRVQPMTKYHLKVMIADAGDGQNDSAVLLEGNSMQSQEQYWRVLRRRKIEEQRIADSTARADSIAAAYAAIEAARLDSIRQDSIQRAELEETEAPEENFEDNGFPIKEERPSQVDPVPKDIAPKTQAGPKAGNDYHSVPPNDAPEAKLLFRYQGDEYFVDPADDPLVGELAAYLKANPDRKVGMFTPDGSQNADLRYDIIRTDLIRAGIEPSRIFRNGFSFLSAAEAGKAVPERLEIWVR